MNRPRACAAILHNDQILMVLHQTAERTYWTLPGGGWEAGETLEQTAVREVKEESGLNVRVVKLLFEEEYEFGKSYCYLAELIDEMTELTLAFNPKEPEPLFDTVLLSVVWHPLKDKKDDIQVSKVISILELNVT
jgi:8-oxo-dGTP diphosphatase